MPPLSRVVQLRSLPSWLLRRKWCRDWGIARLLIETMEGMNGYF
jgi:hypothetical protein